MRKLRIESPFKVDRVEDNPKAFALRREIEDCIQLLFHERNILIYGPRAIGKSSLGIQLQNMLMGDTTLLKRCKINSEFPKYLCARIPCGKNDTLNQIAYNILYFLEKNYINKLRSLNFEDKKLSLELNLGFFKAGFDAKINSVKYSPSTIATVLTEELSKALSKIVNTKIYQGINIMIDELDCLSSGINFAHFFKNVYEILTINKLKHIFFIFAGNIGIYNRLRGEDKSISRIIKTIKIPILKPDELRFILEYAGLNCSTPFNIEDTGKELIVSLSSGFPHIPHLLGDAAFMIMKNESNMTFEDVKIGIENVLKSDKKEEYLDILKEEMSMEEREFMIEITKYKCEKDNTLPVEIPIKWIQEEVGAKITRDVSTGSVFKSLLKKGYIKKNKSGSHCLFAEELLRVFISLARMEREELLSARYEEEEKIKLEKSANEKLLNDIRTGELNLDADLTEEDIRKIRKKINEGIINSRYTTEWEEDDEYNLLNQ
ncbi:MAG: hypothetical protein ACTSXT_10865 [Candidatus Helarchaeota archaeon]